MKNNGPATILSASFIVAVICWIFITLMPQWISKENKPLDVFSVKRALLHVAKISDKPHYVGSPNHQITANYLLSELQKLGLETSVQEGTTLSDWGNLVHSKNILARIKGSQNSKALVLLSHYDSAPHSSSHGASDNAVGVATILEGLRTFIHNKKPHKNDIIILFSDAEELGLNGASLFVTQSDWAKETGLVINFEARGTAGPSYMLMEVNSGNAKMVRGFAKAAPKYPVANSLMYSIYKMLPNDTDLTVFRKSGQIQGFNFAFIDDHFNYHTAQDDVAHLDYRSLAHQGSYLMPLLSHFSNSDLTNMTTEEDLVYFSTPVSFISYPFSWVWPMLIVASVLFVFFIFIGIGKRALIPSEIGKGFGYMIGALVLAGILGFFGWKALLAIYPQYNDILQGFTYNGHIYIYAFICLSLSVAFFCYSKRTSDNILASWSVAPIAMWLIINLFVAIYLPGAGFLIIPVFSALLMLAYFVLTQKSNNYFNLFFSIPPLVILSPLVWMLPIGLGLKLAVATTILCVLTFGLLLPVFGAFARKGVISFLTFLIGVGFLTLAHFKSGYDASTARPNSLVYVFDAENNQARWSTYDTVLDDWTQKYLGNKPDNAEALNKNPLFSKYNTSFTFSALAPEIDLPPPTIEFLRDSIIGTQRHFKIKISPNRKVNRYDIFADEKLVFHNFKANGAGDLSQKGSAYPRKGKKILSYYVVENGPLEMVFSINKNAILDMELFESSFDLLTNAELKVTTRSAAMMPKPFIMNDAIIVRQKIKPTPKDLVPIFIAPRIFSVTDTLQTLTPQIAPITDEELEENL